MLLPGSLNLLGWALSPPLPLRVSSPRTPFSPYHLVCFPRSVRTSEDFPIPPPPARRGLPGEARTPSLRLGLPSSVGRNSLSVDSGRPAQPRQRRPRRAISSPQDLSSAQHRLGTGRRGQSPGTSPRFSPRPSPDPRPGPPGALQSGQSRLGEGARGAADSRPPCRGQGGRLSRPGPDVGRAATYSLTANCTAGSDLRPGTRLRGTIPSAARFQTPSSSPCRPGATGRGAEPGRGGVCGAKETSPPEGGRVARGQRQAPPLRAQAWDSLTLGRGV